MANHYASLVRKISKSITGIRDRADSGYVLDSNFSLDVISDEEWDMLANKNSFEGTKRLKYNYVFMPGDIILKEHETMNHQIFRISVGKCKVVKVVPNARSDEPSSIKIIELHEGDLFGEIGFLLGIRSTATVIADSFVELQIFDNTYLKKLFLEEPMIVLKFFNRVATNLANNLASRSNDGWAPSEK